MVANHKPTEALPSCPEGFGHINRYWDKRMGLPAAKLMPGEFYVSTVGEMISTVLGSCVSACVRDTRLGIGGMNHFMLPLKGKDSTKQWGSCKASTDSRYGNWAMEFLINEILKRGGRRCDLEVKIFGGGKVLDNMLHVGEDNINFVREYLRYENLTIAAEDVGDIYPRKVLYFPDTGCVKVRKLKSTENDTLQRRERDYSERIAHDDIDGSIELFD